MPRDEIRRIMSLLDLPWCAVFQHLHAVKTLMVPITVTNVAIPSLCVVAGNEMVER